MLLLSVLSWREYQKYMTQICFDILVFARTGEQPTGIIFIIVHNQDTRTRRLLRPVAVCRREKPFRKCVDPDPLLNDVGPKMQTDLARNLCFIIAKERLFLTVFA